MKKIFKNRIFQLLITAIIFTGVGVFAESQLNASQITYIDSNNQETTVETALNNLYIAADTTITGLNTQLQAKTTELQTYKNKFDTFTFGLGVSPKSANVTGTSQSSLGYWKQKYKYVKIATSSVTNATCGAYFNDNNWSVQTDISLDTKTELEGHDWLYFKTTTTATNGVCNFNVTFSN